MQINCEHMLLPSAYLYLDTYFLLLVLDIFHITRLVDILEKPRTNFISRTGCLMLLGSICGYSKKKKKQMEDIRFQYSRTTELVFA